MPIRIFIDDKIEKNQVALGSLNSLDYILIGIDATLIISFLIYNIRKGLNYKNCRLIVIDGRILKRWRFFLYVAVYSAIFAAVFTFIVQSQFKILLHGLFLLSVIHNMDVSIPPYVCKRMGFAGTCNCDFYKYNDFAPMVVLGVLGTLIIAIFNLDLTENITMIFIIIFLSLLIFNYLPLKKLSSFDLNPEIQIKTTDELQNFLMTNPLAIKLVIIVDATCDFCKLQINEILSIPEDKLIETVRVLDLTHKDEIDPILSLSLNIQDYNKFPVPSSIIFNSGMFHEQKEGIISSSEILNLIDQ